MTFLKNNNLFSFNYDGKDVFSLSYKKEQTEIENELITTYLFEDGLKVTNIAKRYEEFDAYEWVNYFENTGKENSKIISELWDCDCSIDVGESEMRTKSPWWPDINRVTKIFTPLGSFASDYDFKIDADECSENKHTHFLYMDDEKFYSSETGHSSQGNAPFFNIHNQDKKRGFIAAIGWTGQWNAKISKNETIVNFKSKIEDTNFFLYPGEKIRTSSIVIMKYEGDFFASQNKWRRLIKQEFSYVGKRIENPPYSAVVWGGMNSNYVIDRIEKLVKHNIPVEYIWMDAGWYGGDTEPSLSEWEGDWWWHAGDWQISPKIHLNKMQDIVKVIKDNNKKFILWFEPERANKRVPMVKEKPEFFLTSKKDDYSNLINLGDEEAFNYCLETLTNFISELKIDCYRQDFNCADALCFWREADAENRKGITEIKHINGLYRLWDALLERFPNIIIDNCSGGGRRIDIETLKRSIPLSRSDAQGTANFRPENAQLLNMYCSLWFPYGGSCSGRAYDTYRFRSAYASCLETFFTMSIKENFGESREEISWLREKSEEYLKIRPYFYGDIYHLTEPTRDLSSWNVVQWDRPENKDGMIQVFKHENSPFTDATFKLFGIETDKNYQIEDLDGGEFAISGKELQEGFKLHIKEKRIAKIFLYKQI